MRTVLQSFIIAPKQSLITAFGAMIVKRRKGKKVGMMMDECGKTVQFELELERLSGGHYDAVIPFRSGRASDACFRYLVADSLRMVVFTRHIGGMDVL
jgi:hypothetical protein